MLNFEWHTRPASPVQEQVPKTGPAAEGGDIARTAAHRTITAQSPRDYGDRRASMRSTRGASYFASKSTM
jgi:hypothetical protein